MRGHNKTSKGSHHMGYTTQGIHNKPGGIPQTSMPQTGFPQQSPTPVSGLQPADPTQPPPPTQNE